MSKPWPFLPLSLSFSRLFAGCILAALLALPRAPLEAQRLPPDDPFPPDTPLPPALFISEPNGTADTVSGTFTITWSDFFDGGNARIDLYYDTDNAGTNGTLIVASLSEDDPANQYLWNVSGLAPGSYYVYGVISYPGFLPSVRYSTGPVTVVPPPPADDAAFVSQGVPALMTAGQSYAVTVSLRNTGTTTWTAAAGYGLGVQNPAGTSRWGVTRVPLGASDSVPPQAVKSFNFTVTAPATPGTYNFQWQMDKVPTVPFGALTPNVAVEVLSVTDAPPVAFSFAPVQHALAGREYVSNQVLIGGLPSATVATLSGDAGAQLVVDGQNRGTSASVNNGSTVALRAAAPASGTKTLTLTVGSKSTTWKLTAASQASLPVVGGAAAGETAGEFTVGETGTAAYRIPIAVAPGTAGMAPHLSLVYSSQGSNSLLGVGWSLAGLSMITRCPTTLAQDGFIDGLDFDGNDRFCLDGERLMAVAGVYGADGTEYRTEQDSFQRVVSYGNAGGGPERFLAWNKDGLELEFGFTADSRIEGQGRAQVLVWAVNRITDSSSNRMDVTYQEVAVNGEFRPLGIDYTANAVTGLAPYASVEFLYEARPDVFTNYLAGSILRTTQRLKSIGVLDGNQLYREYRLAYQSSPLSSGRSLLASVQECGSDGSCLAPTRFQWSSSAAFGMSSPTWLAANAWGGSDYTWADDFNGDGRTDLASAQSGNIRMKLATGSGFVSTTWPVVNLWGGGNYTRVADFNGDGLPDIASPSGGNVYMKLSTG
ncbi:MAG: VCBS repeat-containing protein, partial [Acidobacteria bacterium]|nr:VCBS repeat-containing protein [Acidobacteriota bacterium]